MIKIILRLFLVLMVIVCQCHTSSALDVAAADLPSWKDGPTKRSILEYVKAVTDDKSADYLKPSERIAVFDNDGTLWCEQPIYTQVQFAMDRVKVLAKTHPEYNNQPLLLAAMNDDVKTLTASGYRGITELFAITHTDMSTDEFASLVKQWTATAKHPRFHHLYTECVYQPMLELLSYLRANGFTTYIVSGGGIDFMRPWTEQVYGIPPPQVVGSSCKLAFQNKNNTFTIQRLPEVNFVDDGPGKPVGIQQHIGLHPVLAVGNSDGDLEMLQWTTTGPGKRFGMLVHHTDAVREYAYDKDSLVGRLDKALTQAGDRGWTVVDMKNDWLRVFPFDK